MSLAAILEAGRRDLLEAIFAVPPEHLSAKPNPQSWSILECIEHIIAVEKRFLSWITDASPSVSQGQTYARRRDEDKEIRLFTTIRNRDFKVEAPEAVRPVGRLDSLKEAVAEFNAARDKTVQYVHQRRDDVYTIEANHPRFGKVNGAEMIHLIDGHGRRHAEQIREIAEALRHPETRQAASDATHNRKRAGKTRIKTSEFRRDRPDIPAELAPFTESHEGDSHSFAITERHVRGLNITSLSGSLHFEGSLIEDLPLAGGRLRTLTCKDVRLIHCDLANIRAQRIVLVRVELIDCRLTGLSSAVLEAQDVLFQNSDLRYVQFQGGKFKVCEFDACNCEEADFQNSDLSGSVLRSCNLVRADFRGAKLQGVDFRKSEVDGMLAGVGDLKGAIVDATQAMFLARLMGLQIR